MNSDEVLGKTAQAAVEPPAAARTRVLTHAGDELTEAETLRLALHQAVAELGGMSGMVHLWRGPRGGRRLQLAVTMGLPRDFALSWDTLDRQDEAAPSRALRAGATVWLPATGTCLRPLPAGTGIVALPLPAPAGPLGVLSVVTAWPGEPSAAQRDFLETVARWVSGRLGHPGLVARGAPPTWWTVEQPAGSQLQETLRAARVGTFEWDIRTGTAQWDEVTLTLFGLDPEAFDGRIETFEGLIHPDDLPQVRATHAEAVEKRSESVSEYRVCRPDGTVRWVEARGRVILDADGEPARMTGTLMDTTQKRTAMDSVGRALRHMSDGFVAVSGDWRIAFVNLRAERLLGPAGDLLGKVLWDVSTLRVPDLEARCREAADNGVPVGVDVRLPTDRNWCHMRLVPVPDGLTVYFTDVTEMRLMDERRKTAERAATQRTAHIERLNTALAQAVTVHDVVAAVAELVLPPFGATGLVVQLMEGEYLRVVGSSGYSREFLDKAPDQFHVSRRSPNTDAFTEGAPVCIASRQELRRRYPQFAAPAFIGGRHAWAFLPLIVSGRPVGCCVVSFPQPRPFSQEDRALLTTLSGLVAQAMERARLYDAEHVRAQELQRGLLPQALPSLPAVTVAARYLPATEGLDVGGDWYDVIPLSSDRVCLVIGDVMGHGLSEAATMGRLRTAVHTLAGLELPPDELLSHLNDMVSGLGDDFYATCLYAVYDPITRTCAFACAGHPPPALVHPYGSVRFPEIAADPPLGAATPPFETVELTMPEGSLLVLYTDGLVESSDRDIDSGMSHLARTLATACRRTSAGEHLGGTAGDRAADAQRLDQLCDTITSALIPAQEQTSDDAALLVARTHTTPAGDVASWALPEDPIAASQARDHVRRQLTDWHLGSLVTTTELLASELVGNVIRHARGPIRLRLLRSRSLVCEVMDGSSTTPRIRRALDTDEGGRGLQLVAALSQRWGTRYTADGKCIWTELPLP